MEDFKELDTILREEFLESKKNVDILDGMIDYLSSRDSDDSRISGIKLNKKVIVLKAKIINAFLLRDLELLKTLTEKYLEKSSEFISNLADEIAGGEHIISTEHITSINLDGTTDSGENSYLEFCNREKQANEIYLYMIKILEKSKSV